MGKTASALCFLLLLFLSAAFFTPSTANAAACAVPEGSWIALGDSITTGMSADTYAQSWVGLLNVDLGQTVDNRAISGLTSGDMLTYEINNYAGTAKNAVWLCCINDVRWNYSITYTVNNVGDGITALHAKGVDNIWIAPHVPPAFWYGGTDWWVNVMQKRRADIAQVARDNGAQVVWIAGWNTQTMLASDGLHPNNLGHTQIEKYFWQSITCDFEILFPLMTSP